LKNKTGVEIFLPDEMATLAFGEQLALASGSTASLFLYGDLGAGKTTLTRGFLRGLGYADRVKSPTYTLVEPYEIGAQKVFHFDLYRLQDSSELEFIGLQDYFIPQAICLVEWPQKAEELLPQPDVSCYIMTSTTGRQIRLEASSPHGHQILERLARAMPDSFKN
jgi:tRNA threonylcarbamoyladenosine biosynthesis protein TsaE